MSTQTNIFMVGFTPVRKSNEWRNSISNNYILSHKVIYLQTILIRIGYSNLLIYIQYLMKNSQAQLFDWNFTFKQSGLANTELLEAISEQCNLFRPPTIVFFDTQLLINHKSGKIKLVYNPTQALRFINYETRQKNFYEAKQGEGKVNTISFIPPKLHVKHAEHWKNIEKPKDIEITEIKQSSDSFFLNTFKGLIIGQAKIQKVKQSVIPLQKLGPDNPITCYQQGSFYQDQLDDNGLIQYEYKFRTMANSWFALIRNYARIDGVVVLIFDTRLYWEQNWNKIARQFNVKKASWDELKQKEGDLPAGWRMNPNQSHIIYQQLNQIFVENEYIHYS